MRKISFFALALVVGSFYSCNREGCTDQNATNYDKKAKNDDGSCLYEDGSGGTGGTGGGNTEDPDFNLAGTTGAPQVVSNILTSTTAFDYYVDGTWTIDAAVEIEPGVRIMMKANSKIRVTSNGSLNASGTSAVPIGFIAEQDVQGFWYNLEFDGSNNPNNQLKFVTVHGAGGQSTRPGSIYVRSNSRLVMQNSTVTQSERNGLEVNHNDGRLIDFENKTFTNCNLNAIKLASWTQAAEIDLGTDFSTNNTYNRVLVGNGVITTPIVVNRISGPFNAENVTNIDSDMTITAGTTILMGPGAGMRVTTTGSLAISGTASERVTITGGEQVEGYWGFIQYDGSVNNNNVIEYTDISYGGGSSTRPGNLYLRQNGQVSMGNSSSNYSQRWGVNGVNGTIFNDLGGNTYTGNLEGDNSFN